MAEAQQTTAPAPTPDLRSVFREELKPIQDNLRTLEEGSRSLEQRLQTRIDEVETEVRAVPQMKIQERAPFGSPEDRVLARAFFNRELDEIRALGGGTPTEGGQIVQRAFSQALIATNGTLNAEQAEMFLSLTLAQSGFLQLLNFEPMNGPTKEVHKMDIASRIMRKKTGGQKPANADVAIGTPLVLTSVETGISTQIYFEALEDNIMRGRATNYILDLFRVVFANDLADLAVNGDTSLAAAITDTTPADGFDDTNGDSQNDRDFRRINDGYLALLGADAAVHDVSGSGMAGDVKGALFPALRDALPQRYRRLQPALLTSHKIRDAYLDQLENRLTDLGDMVLKNGWRVPTWQGYPIIGVDHFPDAAAVFTPLSNLVFGVQRAITFGVDVYNAPRYADYAWTIRADFGVKHGDTAALCVDFAFS